MKPFDRIRAFYRNGIAGFDRAIAQLAADLTGEPYLDQIRAEQRRAEQLAAELDRAQQRLIDERGLGGDPYEDIRNFSGEPLIGAVTIADSRLSPRWFLLPTLCGGRCEDHTDVSTWIDLDHVDAITMPVHEPYGWEGDYVAITLGAGTHWVNVEEAGPLLDILGLSAVNDVR